MCFSWWWPVNGGGNGSKSLILTFDNRFQKGYVTEDVLEAFCWMYAHFEIPEDYNGPCSGSDGKTIEGPVYNSYYQWVPIYFIFLALMFYLPRCFWLLMEGGLMKFFSKGVSSRFIEDPEEKRDKLIKVSDIILELFFELNDCSRHEKFLLWI